MPSAAPPLSHTGRLFMTAAFAALVLASTGQGCSSGGGGGTGGKTGTSASAGGPGTGGTSTTASTGTTGGAGTGGTSTTASTGTTGGAGTGGTTATSSSTTASSTTASSTAASSTTASSTAASSTSASSTAASSTSASSTGGTGGGAVGTLCSPCPPGTKPYKTGECVPTNDPFLGCNQGDAPCQVINAIPGCDAQGRCTIGTCRPGFADCNGDPSDGCETDLSGTLGNTCGSCANKCGAGQVCANGACVSTCPFPLTKCGVCACVDLTSSPLSCGACNHPCPGAGIDSDPFGAPACNGAVCGRQCDPGNAVCQGLCQNMNRGLYSCGSCGNTCDNAFPGWNGIVSCNAGVCTQGGCPSGWADCGSHCAVLSSSPTDCGACGIPCMAGQTCQGGQCVATSTLVLASASTPDDLMLDNGQLFFSNKGDSSVRKVDPNGGPVTMIATGQARPVRLAGDGTYVYWSSNLGGAIVRTLEDGSGSPTVIASATSPWGIAVDGTDVYWSDAGGYPLLKAPKGGGTPSQIPGFPSAMFGGGELALVGGVLYVGWSNNIYRVPLPNGPATLIVNTNVPFPVIGGSFLYYGAQPVWWTDLTHQLHGQVGASNAATEGYGADACAVYELAEPSVSMIVHLGDTGYAAPVTVAPLPFNTTLTSGRVLVDATRVFWSDSANIYRALKPQ